MGEDKGSSRRINVLVPAELFEKVESYRFDYRCQNRADAVRQLLQFGLESAIREESRCGVEK